MKIKASAASQKKRKESIFPISTFPFTEAEAPINAFPFILTAHRYGEKKKMSKGFSYAW
jgi:hypothetical protein